MTRLLACVFLVFGFGLQAAVTWLGAETAVTAPLPKHGDYIGFNPPDGAVVSFNPPQFTWCYRNDPAHSYSLVDTYTEGVDVETKMVETFRFQCSSNASFSDTIWDVVCSNNFYNFLPPITNGFGATATNYWRVIYLNSNATVVVKTGDTHHFTLSPTASKWDRSRLADADYLQSIGTNHPHMYFTDANKAAVATFLHSSTWGGWSWSGFTNYCKAVTIESWWNDSSFTSINGLTYADAIAKVCLAYAIDGGGLWTGANPGRMTAMLATNIIANGKDRLNHNDQSQAPKYLGLAYDWAYGDMTADQRAYVLWVLERLAMFCIYEDWWYYGSTADPTRQYAGPYLCGYASAAKRGGSHHRTLPGGAILYYTIAGMGESAILRECQSYALNHLIGQGDHFMPDEGRPYAEQSFEINHNLGGHFLTSITFAEANLHLNPFWNDIAKHNAYWQPLYYSDIHDQFGDYGLPVISYGAYSYIWYHRYRALAQMYTNAPLLTHSVRDHATKNSADPTDATMMEIFVPFYWPETLSETTDWPENVYTNFQRGFAMALSKSPNTVDSFTNGQGLVLTARPHGSRDEHTEHHDGAIQYWAYGTQISCGNVGTIIKHCDLLPGLFVDGVGVCLPAGKNPRADIYSRFISFTNWDGADPFTYMAGEYAQAFPRTNVLTTGLGQTYSPYPVGNLRPYITSVQRHAFWPHKKYLVLFDYFTSTQAAKFEWKWNMMIDPIIVDSNQATFRYIATNGYIWPTAGYGNARTTTVYGAHLTDSNALTWIRKSGQSTSKVNPITGKNLSAYMDLSTPQYQEALWVENKTAATNWHFLSVIYPVPWWNTNVPVFTRISDTKCRVQMTDTQLVDGAWVYAAIDDTIAWGTTDTNDATYIIELRDTTIQEYTTTPSATPGAGSYDFTSSNVLVHITVESGANLYWTTNGTTATVANYNGTTTNCTIQFPWPLSAVATNSGKLLSAPLTETYTQVGNVATPVILPPSGSYSVSSTNGSITCAGGATIYWTTNAWATTNGGGSPQTVPTWTTSPFSISAYGWDGVNSNSVAVTNTIILLGVPTTNANTGQLRATTLRTGRLQ